MIFRPGHNGGIQFEEKATPSIVVEFIRVGFVRRSKYELLGPSVNELPAEMFREASLKQEVNRVGFVRVNWNPGTWGVPRFAQVKTRDIELLEMRICQFSRRRRTLKPSSAGK